MDPKVTLQIAGFIRRGTLSVFGPNGLPSWYGMNKTGLRLVLKKITAGKVDEKTNDQEVVKKTEDFLESAARKAESLFKNIAEEKRAQVQQMIALWANEAENPKISTGMSLEAVEAINRANAFQVLSTIQEPPGPPQKIETGIPGAGIASAAAQKGIGMALKKGASTIATKLGLKAASQAIAGVVAPGIGNVIAFLGTELLSRAKRLLSKLLKDPQSLLGPIVFGGLFFGGLAVGGTVGAVATGVGGLGGIGYLTASGKGASLLNQGVGVGQALVYGVTTAGVAISVPFIVALVSLPIIVALILFIINSGAYLVPPGKLGVEGIPIGQLCMPASGQIIQLAYCESANYTHCQNNSSAYDIINNIGTPIYAVHEGIAMSFPDDPSPTNRDRGYGNYVIVKSDDGQLWTLYAHMLENEIIPPGTSIRVQRGSLIGLMNNTGKSDINHVHFELLRPGGVHIKTLFGEVSLYQQVENCFAK